MPRKLSTGLSRADLIATYSYGTVPPPEAPAPAGQVCPMCEAANDADAVYCDQCGQKLEADAVTASVPVVGEPGKADMPATNPVNENGDIQDLTVCANGDCGHMASAHGNMPGGKNSGPCGMSVCSCQAMQVDSGNDGETDGNDDGDVDGQTAAGPVADAPTPIASGPQEAPELNEPPATEGGESMGPAFTIPVGIIEGQPTGDGRQIAVGALSWRVPPIPLMGLATETHDPSGMDQNDPAVICGRIDSLTRVDGDSGTAVIEAHGYFLPNDDGMYFAELCEAMGRVGVSADVAVQSSETEVHEVDGDGWPMDTTETLTEGTIMGFTICPFAAFEGAYIILGDGTIEPEIPEIPQQDPGLTAAVHWMTYEQCEPCDQGLELVASGAPARPPAAWFSDPAFTEGDGRLVEILDRRGRRQLGGKFACPITVTADGRVFGHIAPWGICHTGTTGQCILAPKSGAGYAHFKRGQHITTAEGDQIRVGVITADTGHANVRGINAASAMAHYDNTALTVADVNAGEDEYGIWVAGAIRPDATAEQIRKLTAASISGDWRQIGGQLELVAALAVNQPGFPLAVVAGGQSALVAAGANVMDRLKHPAPVPEPPEGDVALRAALAPLLADSQTRARIRVAALKGTG